MKIDIKHIFIISSLFFLMIGVVSTASADPYHYDNATSFLDDFNNWNSNSVVTIDSSEANVTKSYTLNVENITIKALNGIVIFKGNEDVHFYIESSNVKLQGITFTNFMISDEGSVVSVDGDNFTICDCNFSSNIFHGGKDGSYGNLLLDRDNHKVINCGFYNTLMDGECSGAGIYISGGYNYQIANCEFYNNSVEYLGGAILAHYVDNATIENCSFIDCVANQEAGAIHIRCANNFFVNNCTFINCKSTKGSAVMISHKDDCCYNFTSLNNRFINCGAIKGYGANIYMCGAKNLNITGGYGAILYNDYDEEWGNATFSNLITVYVLNNETEFAQYGTKSRLYAQVTVGGRDNVIAGLDFNFIVDGSPVSGSFNGTHYIYDYPIDGVLGEEITVGGACDVNASKVEYKNGTLHIKAISPLNITSKDITYGENLTVTLKINQNATGNITLFINGKEFGTEDISKGTAKFTIPSLNVDKYVIEAVYNGDGKYFNVKNSTDVNVRKANPILKVDVGEVGYGEDIKLTIITSYNMTEYLILTLNDESYNVSASTTSFTIPKHLNSGDYTVWISYFGDDNYNSNLNFTKFTVKPIATYTNVFVDSAGGNAIVYINTTDIKGNPAEGYVIVLVNNSHTYSNLIKDGIGKLSINDLPTGHYSAVVTFNSSGDYGVSYGNCSFDINATPTPTPTSYNLTASNVYKEFENATQYYAILDDGNGNPLANRTISVAISSVKWSKESLYWITTDKDGVATLMINLLPNQYVITARYGDEIAINNITVIPSNLNLKADNLVKYFKNSTQYTVKVTDKNNNPVANRTVTIVINKASWKNPMKYYVKTNNDGIATLDINLIDGTYSVTANICYNSAKSTITVLPTLTTSNLVKKVNKEANLKAKLVDGQGNPAGNKEVQYTVKNKTYSLITDSKGVATLPIHLGLGNWSFLIVNPGTGASTRATVKVIK